MTDPQPAAPDAEPTVLTCAELPAGALAAALSAYRLQIVPVADGEPIPASWFGEPEAGIRDRSVFVRCDTPVHSALHEACHLVCAAAAGRGPVDTDAGGGYDEEDAVCYLQILLADRVPGFGRDRQLADMDAWGYTFRLGSARAWFEGDAEDALDWLRRHRLADGAGEPVIPPHP